MKPSDIQTPKQDLAKLLFVDSSDDENTENVVPETLVKEDNSSDEEYKTPTYKEVVTKANDEDDQSNFMVIFDKYVYLII